MVEDELIKLYKEAETFTKYNSEVPESLAREIKKAEAELRQEALLRDIAVLMPKVIPNAENSANVVISCEYNGKELKRIGITTKTDLLNEYSVVMTVSPTDNNSDGRSENNRLPSNGFSVHFTDGKVVAERTAQKTMIEALRYMGLERASRYNVEFRGYPLVGKRQRSMDEPNKWQRNVDGWWVYINISNEKKIEHLKGVAKMLNIPMEIVRNEDNSTDKEDEPDQTHKRAMFSLNGGPAFCKNRSVLNVIRQFISEMPNVKYSDICEYFPHDIQGGYGVFETLSQIAERKAKGQDAEKRYFLGTDEILISGDGVKFAVSTQWGDNFGKFQEHIAKELGWTLEEVQ